jgi:hypothetical protein
MTIWIRPGHVIEKILTLKPHRDTHITYDTCAVLLDYINRFELNTVQFLNFSRLWPGFPDRKELWSLHPALDTLLERESLPDDVTPKQAMWDRIKADYTPSNHPSHIACKTPDGNKPPPAIRAAIQSHDRLITSTIFRFALAHCFDADYSEHFRPSAPDTLICPCSKHPDPSSENPCTPYRHTHHHVIFQCSNTLTLREKHIPNETSLREIFDSEEATLRLCLFLKKSNSSPLRPLPVERPGRDPPDNLM